MATSSGGAGVCHLFVICDDLSMPAKRQENPKKKKKKKEEKNRQQSGRAREHFIKVSRDYQVDRQSQRCTSKTNQHTMVHREKSTK